jgi:hypothetical protein
MVLLATLWSTRGVPAGAGGAAAGAAACPRGGRWYVFACLPAEKFDQRAATPPEEVTFTLGDGQQVRRSFRPDTADWFEASPKWQVRFGFR